LGSSQTVIFLSDKERDIQAYFVGTAHISKQSAEEVKNVIRFVKPNVVMVELCAERAQKLRNDSKNKVQNTKEQHISDIVKFSKGHPSFSDFFSKLLEKTLKSFYDEFRQFGLVPGLEFQVAMEEAEALGAKLILGDQPQQKTFRRIFESLPSLLTLLANISQTPSPIPATSYEDLEKTIESFKNREKMRELRAYIEKVGGKPLIKALIDERDYVLTKSVKDCPRGSRVVGVCGCMHLEGITKYWEEI